MSGAEGGVPAGIEELTAGFVSQALRRSGVLKRASVQSLSCRPIDERRGFVGEAFRCGLSYDYSEEGAPARLVAKFARRDPIQRRAFNQFGLYQREVCFYKRLRAETNLPVPDCYFAEHDPGTGNFLLLLRDLWPATTGNRIEGSTAAEAREAVEAIARMHAGWWADERLDYIAWLPLPNRPHGSGLVPAGYEEIWASFEAQAGDFLPSSIRALGRRLTSKLPSVLDRLSSPPRTLVHGDYQLGNILYSSSHDISGVIDWQVPMKSRGPMDVAHLLVRSLPPEERRGGEAELLRLYHSTLVANGVSDYPLRECRYDYQYAIIAEFALGIVLSFVLSQVMAGSTGPEERDRESLARVGVGRLFAALADLEWERLIGGKRLISFSRRARSEFERT
jgi:hypothetical protein